MEASKRMPSTIWSEVKSLSVNTQSSSGNHTSNGLELENDCASHEIARENCWWQRKIMICNMERNVARTTNSRPIFYRCSVIKLLCSKDILCNCYWTVFSESCKLKSVEIFLSQVENRAAFKFLKFQPFCLSCCYGFTLSSLVFPHDFVTCAVSSSVKWAQLISA